MAGWRNGIWALLAVVLMSCGPTPAPPSPVSETVRTFYEAILHQDWERASSVLHPDSRARCPADTFASLAQQYRRGLGFEPAEVHIRSCEEHGSEAVAHVTLTGQATTRPHFFKDAVTLRQSSAGWGVVLSPRFGKTRPR